MKGQSHVEKQSDKGDDTTWENMTYAWGCERPRTSRGERTRRCEDKTCMKIREYMKKRHWTCEGAPDIRGRIYIYILEILYSDIPWEAAEFKETMPNTWPRYRALGSLDWWLLLLNVGRIYYIPAVKDNSPCSCGILDSAFYRVFYIWERNMEWWQIDKFRMHWNDEYLFLAILDLLILFEQILLFWMSVCHRIETSRESILFYDMHNVSLNNLNSS